MTRKSCRGAAWCFTLPFAAGASGQLQDWNNAAGGPWNDPVNWLGLNEPDTDTESARFALAGVYTVDLRVSRTIRDLYVLNPSATIRVASPAILMLAGASFKNDGRVAVTSQGIPGAMISLRDGASIDGTGEMTLYAVGGSAAPLLSVPTGGRWTHGAGHTIRGRGLIRAGAISNHGQIRADAPAATLEIMAESIENDGQLQATGGAKLALTGITVSQPGPGSITVSGQGSRLLMRSTTVIGGTMTALDRGWFEGTTGTQRLVGPLTISGPFQQRAGTGLEVEGVIHHSGALTINSDGTSPLTTLVAAAGSRFDGPGTVTLHGRYQERTSAEMYCPPGGRWTNGPGHTIDGYGRIRFSFDNEGVIAAGDMELLEGEVDNRGTISVVLGALALTNETIRQHGSASISAIPRDDVAPRVLLRNATIHGGSLIARGDGKFISAVGAQTLTGPILIDGDFDVLSGTTLHLPPQLTHHGVLTLNPGAAAPAAACVFDGGGLLAGTGSLVLNCPDARPDLAALSAPAGVLINGHGHTISGSGTVSAEWINHGTVRPASPSLDIQCRGGPFTQAEDGTLIVEIFGTEPTSFGRLTGDQPKHLGGRLTVVLDRGFAPAPCDSFTIITGPIVGTFDSLDLPPTGNGIFHVVYSASEVRLVNVTADLNDDGFLDFADIVAFMDCFEGFHCAQGVSADFYKDGFVDFLDFTTFIERFEAGC